MRRAGTASAITITIAVAACSSLSPRPQPAGYEYSCPDGYRLNATFIRDSVILALPDRTARLPQVIAASGARYASADTTFWIKGRTARLELGGTTRENCATSSNF